MTLPPPLATNQDQLLIERLRQRDEKAFAEAIRHYSPVMLATARSMTDAHIAEDIVQETWVAVVDAIHQFEGRSTLKTWLCTIVANRIRSHFRKQHREQLIDLQNPLDAALVERFDNNGHWRNPLSDGPTDTPESHLENADMKDCLDKHIGLLPEIQRGALHLREFKALSTEDVCEILSISHSNLRVALHRARQRLTLMIHHYRETGQC